MVCQGPRTSSPPLDPSTKLRVSGVSGSHSEKEKDEQGGGAARAEPLVYPEPVEGKYERGARVRASTPNPRDVRPH